MSPLSSTAASVLRQGARQQLSALRTQKRGMADAYTKATTASSYSSPFRGTSDRRDTTAIPDFKKYRNSGGENTQKVFQYFMVGSMGAVTALGAKATVQGRTGLHEQPRTHCLCRGQRRIEG